MEFSGPPRRHFAPKSRAVRDSRDKGCGRLLGLTLRREPGRKSQVQQQESSTGTYIHLEVELAQTHCRKQRRAQNCPVKPGGRRQICLACFSFDSRSPDHILDKTMHCISQKSSLLQETKRRHAQECERVKKANGLYLPGQFAFSRGLP
ncbi:retinoic acid receptor responder protein 2 isoform X2 [Anolis carolinensis]|uniref:retinoic acid receptor responder protein 2 isoform X2 n=1 Tax=Anolis carolinensis TaxID=28377 RepID=UPI002F2B6A45